MAGKRAVFFISDRTGITAETLGHSLLTQFNDEFDHITLPFTDSPERADQAVRRVEEANRVNGLRSIVFSTVIAPEIRERLQHVDALVFDFFDTFIAPMEQELGERSSHTIGRSHGMIDNQRYDVRIDAMNYALSHDDGAVVRHYDQADVILVGVSRSGKTPTCIYLALQYGIYAANYPLTEEDLLGGRLPSIIRPHRRKLYALTIRPDRLSRIRSERRPDSRYASLRQCQYEVARAEGLFEREKLPMADTTAMSIEEIATTIIHNRQLRRRLY
ncbi:Phosphoenolpyruvate synthase regulatory protein [wastewater metagenome]|uniref:Phosphoenolpyruvate synthase regulatory protein n=2 Tax=unclassified sequences TaxID=12908 RepID=A0A5B8R7Z2_9ZZZZ|nr:MULTISPECIES: pyruvate, water dikinase regulatory protein [Arhodomonas]MCS4504384.1 kinase/pyrophosphorylase [Arhodomonas aquaeolei]QEA04581.1 phosphoenolpyruvate synthase regulatory protein [uncultured organism]